MTTISGVVRIDLSGYVQDRHLLIPDRRVGSVVRDVLGNTAVELYVGRIIQADWDPRVVEALAMVPDVSVTGPDAVSVGVARGSLRVALDERIPGPRSAS